MCLNIFPKAKNPNLNSTHTTCVRPESFPPLNSRIGGAPIHLALSSIADGLSVIGRRISLSCWKGSVASLCSQNNYRVGAGSIRAERGHARKLWYAGEPVSTAERGPVVWFGIVNSFSQTNGIICIMCWQSPSHCSFFKTRSWIVMFLIHSPVLIFLWQGNPRAQDLPTCVGSFSAVNASFLSSGSTAVFPELGSPFSLCS